MNKAEEKVSDFYNTVGWATEAGETEDARRWEDLRRHARAYVSKCRLRVLRHLPERGVNLLDMASGPIQYPEYLEYSRHFEKRYCVDLSAAALDSARRKIGERGVFLHGSFFDLPLEDDFFDAAISLHTIYHIDRDRQEEAVRKLIRVTKPGQPIIIVYSNPETLLSLPFRTARRLKSALIRASGVASAVLSRTREAESDIYFHSHPIAWWKRFRDAAVVKIYPWRSFDADKQKALVPDNPFGSRMLEWLFEQEDRLPDFFVRHFQYPMIVLRKLPRV